jgi:hypothetical protein
MWHDMFVEQLPLAEKVFRRIVVYALLMVLFRLTGKRRLAAMNTFDFIVIFLLSNVVQNAVIGNDNSLLGGMVGAVTLRRGQRGYQPAHRNQPDSRTPLRRPLHRGDRQRPRDRFKIAPAAHRAGRQSFHFSCAQR